MPSRPAARRYADAVTTSDSAELLATVALLRHRGEGVRWSDIVEELLRSGSAVEALQSSQELTLTSDDDFAEALQLAEADVAAWSAQGIQMTTILDADYPSQLRDIHEAPPILFYRGTLRPADRAVSVVGSRKASERGLDMASAIAEAVTAREFSVAAGLAEGIDTAAHRACLEAGGRTVAVIGTGITRKYPKSNAALHDVIADRGLLLSQFWPDAPPQKHTFLMRNATMSGYSLATVVVEAGEISGARAQARMAVGHGRPVVLTDLVLERNDWAKALDGRPGVYIVSSLGQFESALTEIEAIEAAPTKIMQRFAVA